MKGKPGGMSVMGGLGWIIGRWGSYLLTTVGSLPLDDGQTPSLLPPSCHNGDFWKLGYVRESCVAVRMIGNYVYMDSR